MKEIRTAALLVTVALGARTTALLDTETLRAETAA